MFFSGHKPRSATPILDLETAPPATRSAVGAKGLLTALPVAIGLVALIPVGIYLWSVLGTEPPSWLSTLFSPVSKAIGAAFQDGPWAPIASIWLAMFLAIVIHEGGHALAAKLVGWPILEFRVAPFSLQKYSGNWKLQISWRMSPPALVMSSPSATRFHSKVRTFALAGPVANLATGALMTGMQSGAKGSVLSLLPPMFAAWSIATGLLNMLPVRFRGVESDGYVAFVVSRKPGQLAARVAAIKMRNHMRTDKPLESMNQRWVALAESVGQASLQNRGGIWFAYSYRLERDEFERAALILEKLLQRSHNVEEGFRVVLFAEAAIISALRGRCVAATTWKERANTYFVPELILHRCNSYVAWANKHIDEARLEAQLAQSSAAKLHDQAARERFLQSWKRWMRVLESARATTSTSTTKHEHAAAIQ